LSGWSKNLERELLSQKKLAAEKIPPAKTNRPVITLKRKAAMKAIIRERRRISRGMR